MASRTSPIKIFILLINCIHNLLPLGGSIFIMESAITNFPSIPPKFKVPPFFAMDIIRLLVPNTHSTGANIGEKGDNKKSLSFKISAAYLVLFVRYIEALSSVTVIGSSSSIKLISVNFININKNLINESEFVVLLPMRATQSPLDIKANIVIARLCHLSFIIRSLRHFKSHG